MRKLVNWILGGNLGSNSWILCIEIFWSTIYASGQTFNGAYAIRLGATNTEVSLLTSIPALTAMLVLLPAGRFLQSRQKRKSWLLGGLLLYRVGTLLFVLVPWMHVDHLRPGTLFVIVVVFLTLPLHFFNLGFIPFLSQAVEPRQRADAFAARNAIMGAVLSVSNFLFGLWLVRIIFPTNYQVMYLLGFVMSLISLYFLSKVQVPEPERPPAPRSDAPFWKSIRAQWSTFVTAVTRVRGFNQILINTFLHSVGLWAAGPLYLLYFVRNLGATEAWLGEFSALASLATIFGYLFWRRVIVRWGEPKVLQVAIMVLGFYPLLVGAIPSLATALLAAAFNGLVVPGVTLSHFNTFLRLIPEDQHHDYTAFYLTLMNIGAFICPLIGVGLANRFGFAPVLVGCGLVTIVGSSSFWIWPVIRGGRPEPDLASQGE